MNAPNTETLAPPPGVIGSLRAGFDTIAAHLTAILLPLVLDLFLWLGPRLSLEQLFQPALAVFQNLAARGGVSAEAMLQNYKTALHEFNLLSLLRTFPIGVSSLMAGAHPPETPLGAPVILQIESITDMLGWSAVLMVIGWAGGALYFHWVASLIPAHAASQDLPVGGPALQSILFSALWLLVAFTLGLPVFLLVYVLVAINPVLAQAVLLFLGFLAMWLVVPLFFSPLGIFVRRQSAIVSVLSGLQLARFTLPASSLFVLSVLLISIGLNFVWSIPPVDSWMSLVGIFGHAFISTALLAASFIYYRDMTAWLQAVLDRIKAGAATPQA